MRRSQISHMLAESNVCNDKRFWKCKMTGYKSLTYKSPHWTFCSHCECDCDLSLLYKEWTLLCTSWSFREHSRSSHWYSGIPYRAANRLSYIFQFTNLTISQGITQMADQSLTNYLDVFLLIVLYKANSLQLLCNHDTRWTDVTRYGLIDCVELWLDCVEL